MKRFKSKLLKRVESLENYFGLYFTVDSDGYIEHRLDKQDTWSELPKLEDRIKKLEEERIEK